MNKFAMKENGFEYVDLGLPSGTMWAICNVGADKPEDSGLLFQFGRVDGYKYGDKNQFIEKKFIENNQTTTSGKTYKRNNILDLEDDAAYVHWGGKWRMPTKCQLKELLDNTAYDVETINGVKGVLFISKNGHHLFIPFAGYWRYGKYYSNRSYGLVWSSQVDVDFEDSAKCIYCNNSISGPCIYLADHFYAFSVRGVFKNNIN